MTPTDRSLAKLRSEGWTVATIVSQDLFQFANLLAFKGSETALIQSTTAAHFATAQRKIKESRVATEWIHQGFTRKIIVHVWRPQRSNRAVWTCREVVLQWPDESDFAALDALIAEMRLPTP